MDSIYQFRMNVAGKKKLEQTKATGAKYPGFDGGR
jgi:hypothetical protein